MQMCAVKTERLQSLTGCSIWLLYRKGALSGKAVERIIKLAPEGDSTESVAEDVQTKWEPYRSTNEVDQCL